jgi:hypothetical protein
MFHNSVNFHLNYLKTSNHKKNIEEVTFFQNFKMEEYFMMAPPTAFFIRSGLAQPFLNRFQHINLFWTCKSKYFHIPLARNNSIKMESIFKMAIFPSEPCIFKPTIFDSHRRLYKNQWHVWVFWFIVYKLCNWARIRTILNKDFLKLFFITFWRFFRSFLSLELIQWYMLVVQIIKKILEPKKQNGGQNQDGRQAWIFHNSGFGKKIL